MKRTFEGVWNRRIYDLMGALGWTKVEVGFALGCRDKRRRSINRVLAGGRPSVGFLLTLQKLEKAYEGEIQQFIKSKRPFKLYRRKRLEGTLHASPRRPADIATVGEVGSVRENQRLRRRKDAERARANARRSFTRKRKRKEDKEVRFRQSYAEFKRQRAFARKLKGAVNALQKEGKGDGTRREGGGESAGTP